MAAYQERLRNTPPNEPLAPAPDMPRYLQLYQDCQTYHQLLVAGGILDQPFLLWTAVQTAGAAYAEAQVIQENIHRVREELARTASRD